MVGDLGWRAYQCRNPDQEDNGKQLLLAFLNRQHSKLPRPRGRGSSPMIVSQPQTCGRPRQATRQRSPRTTRSVPLRVLFPGYIRGGVGLWTGPLGARCPHRPMHTTLVLGGHEYCRITGGTSPFLERRHWSQRSTHRRVVLSGAWLQERVMRGTVGLAIRPDTIMTWCNTSRNHAQQPTNPSPIPRRFPPTAEAAGMHLASL
jgi:hypothetical protein